MNGSATKTRRDAEYQEIFRRFPCSYLKRTERTVQVPVYDAQNRKTGKTRTVIRIDVVLEGVPTIKGRKSTIDQLRTLDLSEFDQFAPKEQMRLQPLVDIGQGGTDFAR